MKQVCEYLSLEASVCHTHTCPSLGVRAQGPAGLGVWPSDPSVSAKQSAGPATGQLPEHQGWRRASGRPQAAGKEERRWPGQELGRSSRQGERCSEMGWGLREGCWGVRSHGRVSGGSLASLPKGDGPSGQRCSPCPGRPINSCTLAVLFTALTGLPFEVNPFNSYPRKPVSLFQTVYTIGSRIQWEPFSPFKDD